MPKGKILRGRLADNSPNPVDVHVGKRIRLRRQILHLTQTQLAAMLGLTFQQIQKYENGDNRVSASRLWDISQVLQTTTDFYFEDIDASTAALSPRPKNKAQEDINIPSLEDPMQSDEAVTLVRAYLKIRNRAGAKALYDAMVEFSKSVSVESANN